jgi:hypothetical protein
MEKMKIIRVGSSLTARPAPMIATSDGRHTILGGSFDGTRNGCDNLIEPVNVEPT